MRRSVLAAVGGAVLLWAGQAVAADYDPRPYTVASPVSPFSWAGMYLGGNVGYQWGSVSNSVAQPSGFAGGVQVGYNWQVSQFVLGLETDLQLSGANDTFAAWKFSNPWFGTLRGRLGYSLNNILFYGTGGFAYGDLRAELGGFAQTQTLAGWTLGAGMEIGFTPNWSAKVEYLYTNLGSSNFTLTGTSNGLQSNMLRFGVNYRF
jgi:outer membrane immunogenic protein